MTGEQCYAAYNAGGDPATANKDWRGNPCPRWADLPPNVRAKWEAVAAAARKAPVLALEPWARLRANRIMRCAVGTGGPVCTVERQADGMFFWRVALRSGAHAGNYNDQEEKAMRAADLLAQELGYINVEEE